MVSIGFKVAGLPNYDWITEARRPKIIAKHLI
jgi:hypothetical protein